MKVIRNLFKLIAKAAKWVFSEKPQVMTLFALIIGCSSIVSNCYTCRTQSKQLSNAKNIKVSNELKKKYAKKVLGEKIRHIYLYDITLSTTENYRRSTKYYEGLRKELIESLSTISDFDKKRLVSYNTKSLMTLFMIQGLHQKYAQKDNIVINSKFYFARIGDGIEKIDTQNSRDGSAFEFMGVYDTEKIFKLLKPSGKKQNTNFKQLTTEINQIIDNEIPFCDSVNTRFQVNIISDFHNDISLNNNERLVEDIKDNIYKIGYRNLNINIEFKLIQLPFYKRSGVKTSDINNIKKMLQQFHNSSTPSEIHNLQFIGERIDLMNAKLDDKIYTTRLYLESISALGVNIASNEFEDSYSTELTGREVSFSFKGIEDTNSILLILNPTDDIYKKKKKSLHGKILSKTGIIGRESTQTFRLEEGRMRLLKIKSGDRIELSNSYINRNPKYTLTMFKKGDIVKYQIPLDFNY